MDCLGPGALRRVEDALDREVALCRRSGPEEERLVGVGDVEGAAIPVGVDAHGGDPELAEGAEDANRDLSPVGNQNLLEHGRAVFSLRRGHDTG